MSKIKSITIVTGTGVKAYSVGVDDVNRIQECRDKIATNTDMLFYCVFKNDELHAKINGLCPIEIVYEDSL